jgi:pimeloyl-ACP methyl ester carboxylesterase
MLYTRSNVFPRIAYRKYGEGPVIVLLHGFPADGALWVKVWPLLSGFTVIVPDFPGAGESEGIGEELTVELLADCVHTILSHEGIRACVIAGHSMGGYIAAEFTVKYPLLVKGMSMVHSTTSADDDERKEMRKKVIKLIRSGGRKAFIQEMVPNLFSTFFKLNNVAEVQRQVAHSLELKDETLISFNYALMNRPDNTKVLEWEIPVQWIMGKEDNILPPKKMIKQCTIANINFVNLYENCGHLSMIEQPGQMASDLVQFAAYCYGI